MSNHVLRLPFELHSASGGTKQAPIHRPNGADWAQFIWVKNGIGIFGVRDEVLELTPGMGLFTKHDVPCYYYGEDLYTAWIAFFAAEELFTHTLGDKDYAVFDVPPYLQRETEEITALAKGNSTTLRLSAAGYSLVTALLADITQRTDTLIERLRAFLYERYSEQLTLDAIAEAVGLDRFSLCRRLKEEGQASAMKELCAIRITKAKRMLRYTSDSIEAIGKQVGFESHSYFTKRFKELCGCSPREYRDSFFGK